MPKFTKIHQFDLFYLVKLGSQVLQLWKRSKNIDVNEKIMIQIKDFDICEILQFLNGLKKVIFYINKDIT